jgi:hypothetical protein
LQTDLLAASASPRVRYNPKSAEPDPDSEAWRAASGVPEARKNALDFCKGRMLGKDDAFKVVLDPATDPGADKRGLLRSGQVLVIWREHRRSLFPADLRNCSRKGAGIGAAQLI